MKPPSQIQLIKKAICSRHGSYASTVTRKFSDSCLSAAPMAPFPLHAAYRTCPPPRDRRFTSSPLHVSFALFRLARWAPTPAATATKEMAGGCGGYGWLGASGVIQAGATRKDWSAV
jgi:hypothetical protein